MNRKLPQIRFSEPPQWQRERLHRWLTEWNLRHSMEEPEGLAAASSAEAELFTSAEDSSYPESRHDTEVRPGDIRLIPFARPGTEDRPLFCAVLAPWPEDNEQTEHRSWVTCLFSGMAEAGLPSEWQTGEDVPFSVLSLWNSQLAPEGFLRNTWCLETWPNDTRRKALEIYKSWFLSREIPTGLTEEVGPPIRHPDDPRNQYLLEEQDRGNLLAEAIRQWKRIDASIDENADTLITFPIRSPSESILLAARDDSAERPLVTRHYRVAADPATTLQISEAVDPKKLALEVLKDSSGLFEGAGIFDAAAERLGTIADGVAYFDCPTNGRFALRTADGTAILLEESPDDIHPI